MECRSSKVKFRLGTEVKHQENHRSFMKPGVGSENWEKGNLQSGTESIGRSCSEWVSLKGSPRLHLIVTWQRSKESKSI